MDGATLQAAVLVLWPQGTEWKDVMAFGVHSDGVVVIEGPVGYKRTWWLPGSGAEE